MSEEKSSGQDESGPMTFEKLADIALHGAEGNLKSNDGKGTVLVAIMAHSEKNGLACIVMADGVGGSEPEKDIFAWNCRKLLKKLQATKYVMVMETWYANVHPADLHLQPSKMESRREGIMITGGSIDGAQFHQLHEIIRNDDGTFSRLEPDKGFNSAMAGHPPSGRMIGFLNEEHEVDKRAFVYIMAKKAAAAVGMSADLDKIDPSRFDLSGVDFMNVDIGSYDFGRH